MTHRIYYTHGYDDSEEPETTQDVLVILQQVPSGTWQTEYGSDYYVRDYGRWVGKNAQGFVRWLKVRGLLLPKIGTVHDVLHRGAWMEVDWIGFEEWVEDNRIALIGQIAPDDVWNEVMKKVLADKHYAEEHGELPE
jgi:hypothetical protein